MSDVAIWDRAPAPRSIRGGDGRAEAQSPDRCGKTRSFRAAAMLSFFAHAYSVVRRNAQIKPYLQGCVQRRRRGFTTAAAAGLRACVMFGPVRV